MLYLLFRFMLLYYLPKKKDNTIKKRTFINGFIGAKYLNGLNLNRVVLLMLYLLFRFMLLCYHPFYPKKKKKKTKKEKEKDNTVRKRSFIKLALYFFHYQKRVKRDKCL